MVSGTGELQDAAATVNEVWRVVWREMDLERESLLEGWERVWEDEDGAVGVEMSEVVAIDDCCY